MRRVVSLWLPYWPTERLARRLCRRQSGKPHSPASAEPLVLVAGGRGGLTLAAVGPAAEAEGLRPGLPLADARALCPGLKAHAMDPVGDVRALAALADWCLRFTPWVALDGAQGLWLDVTGCAHLFGGERALIDRLVGGLERFGLTARAALAETPGAAHAAARFLTTARAPWAVVPRGGVGEALAPLPVAALRLAPCAAAELERLGLKRVKDLGMLPRAPLAARFGEEVVRRLDEALGRVGEPISPRRAPVPWRLHRVFPEPLTEGEGVRCAVAALVADLCRRLEGAGRGLRRLELTLFRVDRASRRLGVGTARPNREPKHLLSLLKPRLEAPDLGFGVEAMILAAPVIEPLPFAQLPLAAREEGAPGGGAEDLGALIDRLANRLGTANVIRLVPRDSHIPERAVHAVPALASASARPWPDGVVRPLSLLPRPEPIEAVAMMPDAPPALFLWRGRPHRVAHAAGPERLTAEWWRAAASDPEDYRDYYHVEDTDGGRFWVYRRGPYRPGSGPLWYLHGLFA
ncbi:MAG: DUF6504 family protein [Alphaproteobacteria bacterium]